MDPIKLFTGVSGLNTKVDPVRVQFNANAGVSDLSSAVDITIDNTGRPGRRLGWNLKTAGELHSLWCDGGDCYCIEETASYASIMQVGSDLSFTGIRSGLTKNKRMAFCDVKDSYGSVYYCNGVENGLLVGNASYAWPVGTYEDTDSTRAFFSAPIGSHLTYHLGRIVIAAENTLWLSDPYEYGLYETGKQYWTFPSKIRMVKSVDAGLFVSDENYLYFLKGTSALDFQQKRVANYPAHEWSVATDLIEVDDLGFDGETGLAAVWSSPKGLCIGLPSGRMQNLTKAKIVYPEAYNKGASLVCGYHIINTMY